MPRRRGARLRGVSDADFQSPRGRQQARWRSRWRRFRLRCAGRNNSGRADRVPLVRLPGEVWPICYGCCLIGPLVRSARFSKQPVCRNGSFRRDASREIAKFGLPVPTRLAARGSASVEVCNGGLPGGPGTPRICRSNDRRPASGFLGFQVRTVRLLLRPTACQHASHPEDQQQKTPEAHCGDGLRPTGAGQRGAHKLPAQGLTETPEGSRPHLPLWRAGRNMPVAIGHWVYGLLLATAVSVVWWQAGAVEQWTGLMEARGRSSRRARTKQQRRFTSGYIDSGELAISIRPLQPAELSCLSQFPVGGASEAVWTARRCTLLPNGSPYPVEGLRSTPRLRRPKGSR